MWRTENNLTALQARESFRHAPEKGARQRVQVNAPQGIYTTSYGIEVDACSLSAIHDNSVTSGVTDYTGMYNNLLGVSISSSLITKVCSNLIQNFERDLEYTNNNNGSYIINNQFYGGKYGFVIKGAEGYTGVQGLPFHSSPGFYENHNQWLNFKGLNVTGNYYLLNDGSFSQSYINIGGEMFVFNGMSFTTTNDAGRTIFHPDLADAVNYPMVWFKPAKYGIPFFIPDPYIAPVAADCQITSPCSQLVANTTGLREELIQDTTQMDSMLNKSIYSSTFQDTDLIRRVIMDTMIYKFDTSGVITEEETTFSAIKHFFEKQELYELILTDSGFTYSDTALINHFIDTTTFSDIGLIYDAEKKLGQYLNGDSTISIEEVNTDVDNIEGNIQASLNSKILLPVYEQVFSYDSTTLDSASRATLFAIATQCPWVGGRAVYQARTVLAEFDTVYVDYTQWCEGIDSGGLRMEQLPVAEKANNTGTLKVYPNPTGGLINIEYTAATDNTWFKLYGLLGNELAEVKLNKGNGIIQYSLSKLSDGLYIYTVKGLQGNETKEGRIVISKL